MAVHRPPLERLYRPLDGRCFVLFRLQLSSYYTEFGSILPPLDSNGFRGSAA